MKKELFVITAYHSDQEKLKITQECLSSIDRDRYDILLSYGGKTSDEILSLVDYAVYLAKNELITNPKHKPIMWFDIAGNIAYTTEAFETGYHLAALRLINQALAVSKALGYQKVHHIEYDSILRNDLFFRKASEKLDSVTILYSHWPDDEKSTYPLFSVRVDELPFDWLDTDQRRFRQMLIDSPGRNYLENFLGILTSEIDGKEIFSMNDYESNIQLHTKPNNSSSFSFVTPLRSNQEIYFLAYTHEKPMSFELFVDQEARGIFELPPNNWKLLTLDMSKDSLIEFVFADHTRTYDFSCISFEEFFSCNYISKDTYER
jgi:hypothetical protein